MSHLPKRKLFLKGLNSWTVFYSGAAKPPLFNCVTHSAFILNPKILKISNFKMRNRILWNGHTKESLAHLAGSKASLCIIHIQMKFMKIWGSKVSFQIHPLSHQPSCCLHGRCRHHPSEQGGSQGCCYTQRCSRAEQVQHHSLALSCPTGTWSVCLTALMAPLLLWASSRYKMWKEAGKYLQGDQRNISINL